MNNTIADLAAVANPTAQANAQTVSNWIATAFAGGSVPGLNDLAAGTSAAGAAAPIVAQACAINQFAVPAPMKIAPGLLRANLWANDVVFGLTNALSDLSTIANSQPAAAGVANNITAQLQSMATVTAPLYTAVVGSPPSTVPVVTSVSLSALSGKFRNLTVNGTGFLPGAKVVMNNLNGKVVTIMPGVTVQADQNFAPIPTSVIPTTIIINQVIFDAGTWTIQVVNPGNVGSVAPFKTFKV